MRKQTLTEPILTIGFEDRLGRNRIKPRSSIRKSKSKKFHADGMRLKIGSAIYSLDIRHDRPAPTRLNNY